MPEEFAGYEAMYWTFKKEGSIKVWSGFRTYESSTDTNPTYMGDAEPVDFTFYDWPGVTDPNASSTDDAGSTDDGEGSGAAALISASAVALAAFLVF